VTKVDDVIAQATTELGRPYVYGAEGPNSFDCSGLMQWVFGKIGISLPRTAAQQMKATQIVNTPQPGDLVFWGNPAYHVALYIGGGKIIDAPHTGAVVKIQNVWGKPSKYGRVSGLGAGLAPVVGSVTAGLSTVGNTVTDWLGGARTMVLEFLVVGLGVALVGFGVYRSVIAPQIKKAESQIEELL